MRRALSETANFPRRVLREPSGSLSRAHIAVITKADRPLGRTVEALVETISRYVPKRRYPIDPHRGEVVFLARLLHDLPFEEVEGMSVMAFSAIGDPESFRGSLEKGGVRVGRRGLFSRSPPLHSRDMERYAVRPTRPALKC
jgi:tetraacyldisaccharide 4'-kinase